MKVFGILAVLAAAVLTTPAQTNAPQARNISLTDCIQAALEKNLDLRIARYTPQQARYDLRAAYAGYDPAFSASGQHGFNRSGGGFSAVLGTNSPTFVSDRNSFDSSLGGLLPWGLNYTLSGNVSESYGIQRTPFDSSSGSAAVTLNQPLLKNFWIDNTRLNVRIAKNQVKFSELGLRQSINSTATLVEKAYFDLIAARANVQVQEKAVELAVALLNENKKRVEVGAMAPLDAQDAEAQAASTAAALIRAQLVLRTQLEVVKGLIGDDFAAWSETDLVPVDLLSTNRQLFDLQQSWTIALTQRPDLMQARINIENQGITLKYNRNQLFPQLDLVGSYGHNAGGVREFTSAFDELRRGNKPSYYYGAQISFPIVNIAARAAYKQGKLTLESLLLTLKQLEQGIMIEVHNDIGTVNADFDNMEASRKAREFAEAALAAEQTKLQNGKSTTYTVLQKQRDLTTARAAEVQALANYNKDLSELSFDKSTTLERLGIDLEMK